jgi:hypothetical protein
LQQHTLGHCITHFQFQPLVVDNNLHHSGEGCGPKYQTMPVHCSTVPCTFNGVPSVATAELQHVYRNARLEL